MPGISVKTKPCTHCGEKVFSVSLETEREWFYKPGRGTFDLEQRDDGDWTLFKRKGSQTVYATKDMSTLDNKYKSPITMSASGFVGHWESCKKTKEPRELTLTVGEPQWSRDGIVPTGGESRPGGITRHGLCDVCKEPITSRTDDRVTWKHVNMGTDEPHPCEDALKDTPI